MTTLARNFLRRKPSAVVQRQQRQEQDATYADMIRLAQNSYTDAAMSMKAAYMSALGEAPVATIRDLADMYRKSVAVYACVNYIAYNLALVEYEIQTEKGTRVDTPMQQVFTTDFKNVAMRQSVSMSLKGASLSRIIRSDGLPVKLRWINFNLWQRKMFGDPVRLRGFTISRNINNMDLPSEIARTDAFYTNGVDPDDDNDGVSPAEASFLHAGVTVEMASTQLRFFQNSAVPAMHFQPTESQNWIPQPKDRDDLAGLLRRMFMGAMNVGRNLITPTRWEVKQYQTDFDKLGMDALHDQAEGDVFMAFLLPKELLSPSASGYAQAYESRRGWLETYLKPQSEFEADQYTTQIVRPYNTKWKVVPKFDKVPGFRLDIAQRTTTVKDQVQGTLTSLYDGIKAIGVSEPPESFRKLWVINGKPIPEDKIATMYEDEQKRFEAKALAAPRMGGRDGARDKQPQSKTKPARPTEGEQPLPKQDERPTSSGSTSAKSDFLPDDIFKELTNWRNVVGKGREFEVRLIPADVGAYGKFLIASGLALDDSFTRIRANWHESKTLDSTTARYRSVLYGLVTDALSEKIDRKSFGDLGRAEVSQAFRSAWFDGMRKGGVDTDELDEDEAKTLGIETKAERSYFTGFANDIYKTAVPLLKQAKAARAAGDPAADDLFDQFNTKRDQIVGRLDKWANGLRSVNSLGELSAKANSMKKWRLGDTDKHCDTCKKAEGQVHRARKWKKKGLYPGAHSLICTGINCACFFEDTDEKENGNIDDIPVEMDLED